MNSQLLYQFNPWWEGEYHLENVLPRPGLQQHLESLLDNRDNCTDYQWILKYICF